MKEKKRLLVLVLALICTFSILMPLEVQAATVKLNATKKTIEVGKTTTLKVKGTTKTVKWNSSNKKIATVSSKGKVKGIKTGKCTISAKVDGTTYKCKVTVKKASTGKLTKEQAQAKIEAACRAHGLLSAEELVKQLWDAGEFADSGLTYNEILAEMNENCSWFETAVPKTGAPDGNYYPNEYDGNSGYRIVFARETDRNYIFTCYTY